jgi:hypothetical protein
LPQARREGTQTQPEREMRIQGRLRDLALAIAYPKANERLKYMQALMGKKGFRYETAADYNQLGLFLAANLVRMLRENEQLARLSVHRKPIRLRSFASARKCLSAVAFLSTPPSFLILPWRKL